MISAARDVEIRQAISIRVEEHGPPILVRLVGLPRLPLRGCDETAVLLLDVQHAWHACGAANRSEEHTSELQSHSDLVCRLLLEKNTKKDPSRSRFIWTVV